MGIFSGRHFPRDIILWAVRWYCRYGVSYRDLEEMMTERGVPVDHTTIYRWVQKYAPELDKQTRWYRQVPDWQASSWRVDETVLLQTRVFVENGGSGTSVALHTNK